MCYSSVGVNGQAKLVLRLDGSVASLAEIPKNEC